MADDIVTRLRDVGFCGVAAQQEAADEIERLRAAGDALLKAHVYDLCDCFQPECVAIRAAHDAWQRARRG